MLLLSSFNLDPLQNPNSSVKELHTTLDGKHWSLDDPRRTTRRSKAPVGPSVDHSRAPSKTRTSSPTLGTVDPRVLFPSTSSAPSPESPSSPGPNPEDFNPDLEHSFLDDFVPRAISGSDLITGSSIVLQSTASALNTTAAAVRQMFSSSTERPSGPRDAPRGPDDTLRARAPGDTAPRAPGDAPPPTPQQFAEL